MKKLGQALGKTKGIAVLYEYLEKLDKAIDPNHQAESEDLTRRAVAYEPIERLPLTINCPAPDWPSFTYQEIFSDKAKMLLSELAPVWVGANVRDDRVFTVRANYGVGAIASMFGCRVHLTEDNTMPWVEHLDDAALDKVLESGDVNINSGLGEKVFETQRFYVEVLSQYEKLNRWVHIYLSDTQGPFDNAHLIMGHKIYTELYDNPERVHRLLDLVTDTYIRYTRAQKDLVGESGHYSYHSQMIVRGAVRICDDSGINLSRELYKEFCKPYNERIFSEFGGGWIHYCGGGQQILPEVLSTKGLTGINFGQPEFQDLEAVYEAAAPKSIAVLGWIGRERVPRSIKTGITIIDNAPDLQTAKSLMLQHRTR
ncbi:MAG: uroporphyrinogen decarboxylase family protein [Armatimonadota bacterium]|nr:uroporphyrinogen decarboxylase family protein [Armatimonadota bacterium]